MTGYLICEDGPLAKWLFTFEDGDNWTIGRDGDTCTFVLEDPMVSRKHLAISLQEEKFFVENESATNPALLNDEPIEEKQELHPDDLIQIGNNIFRFTLELPQTQEEAEGKEAPKEEPAAEEKKSSFTLGHFPLSENEGSKWLIKVITGPGSGATFPLNSNTSYIVGSDSKTSDILLHDLSISKNHAKLSVAEDGTTSISDLNSRNGVFVDGRKVETEECALKAQDLITLGTTSLLFIDIDHTRDTIYSPGITSTAPPKEESIFSEEEEKSPKETKNWKDTVISKKLLAGAAVFTIFITVGVFSLLSLFKSTEVAMPIVDRSKEIRKELAHFEDVEFNFNPDSATLFLSGHVLTEVDYNELLYRIKGLMFIGKTDDNVVIDELVSENINALIMKNPNWNSILMTSRKPGTYELTGYVQTETEKAELTDFINKYFNYLNLLQNKVVVEETLNTQIQNLLIRNGLSSVQLQQNTGRVILAGRAHENQKNDLEKTAKQLSKIHGVRVVKNFVIFTTASTLAIDLTGKYRVTGSSKFGDQNEFVLINGKILGVDDRLDGMLITHISNKQISLTREGMKYKIDFNES